jgi:hypothetical protein
MFFAWKGKNQTNDSYRGEGSRRGHKRKNFIGRGVGIIPLKDIIFIMIIGERMDHMKEIHEESLGRR